MPLLIYLDDWWKNEFHLDYSAISKIETYSVWMKILVCSNEKKLQNCAWSKFDWKESTKARNGCPFDQHHEIVLE